MKLHNLRPASGSVKGKTKRIGRGTGSGHGGTATKGHKGDKSRSGHKLKRNFEGGQMPLQMRLPKVGFTPRNRVEFVPINLGRLQEFYDKYGIAEITLESLVDKNVVGKKDKVKILNHGELSTKLVVSAHAISESAKETIEKLGGSINLV